MRPQALHVKLCCMLIVSGSAENCSNDKPVHTVVPVTGHVIDTFADLVKIILEKAATAQGATRQSTPVWMSSDDFVVGLSGICTLTPYWHAS
jgi:hypothetical protein